ncbi:MAG TPA: glycosyltransferase family 87 protein, partial [Xanthobacteraceae bacterium]|nr:glycosyltransferase family 87 protein [Xanthobacteraceae bacterium]
IWNITAGQNGFLTAALIGGTLSSMERRPALAGVFLGLLTYKPQFGLLFPLVLIADRRWLTIAVAACVAIGMAVASWLAFGIASWQAFFHWLPISSHIILGEGRADFGRLQSLYGLVRAHGGDETLAWSVQAVGSLAVAAGIVWLWRSRAAYELKAGALAAAVLVATPYVYMYDVVVLGVAVAFLLRYALDRGITSTEIVGLAAAGALILAFPYVKTQVGLAAVLIVLALIVQHVVQRPLPAAHGAGPAAA